MSRFFTGLIVDRMRSLASGPVLRYHKRFGQKVIRRGGWERYWRDRAKTKPHVRRWAEARGPSSAVMPMFAQRQGNVALPLDEECWFMTLDDGE